MTRAAKPSVSAPTGAFRALITNAMHRDDSLMACTPSGWWCSLRARRRLRKPSSGANDPRESNPPWTTRRSACERHEAVLRSPAAQSPGRLRQIVVNRCQVRTDLAAENLHQHRVYLQRRDRCNAFAVALAASIRSACVESSFVVRLRQFASTAWGRRIQSGSALVALFCRGLGVMIALTNRRDRPPPRGRPKRRCDQRGGRGFWGTQTS